MSGDNFFIPKPLLRFSDTHLGEEGFSASDTKAGTLALENESSYDERHFCEM